MISNREKLTHEINQALRRWRRGVWIRGLALILVTVAAGLGVLLLLEGQWQEKPWIIPLTGGLVLLATAAASWIYLARPLRRKITPAMVARSIEERHPELEDRLVTAVDQTAKTPAADDLWLRRLVDDAVAHSANIPMPALLQVSGYHLWQSAAMLGALAILSVFIFSASWRPELLQLADRGFRTPKPVPELQVLPGDAKIKRGESLQVQAIIRNFFAEKATLFYSVEDSSWSSDAMQEMPNGEFQYRLFGLEDSLRYYVQVQDELSDIFTVTTYNAPSIERIDLTYTYPKETGLPQHYARDSGDIWAPAGTRVKIYVTSADPVVRAELLRGDRAGGDMQLLTDSTAMAYLRVSRDDTYSIRLHSREGLDNEPLDEYYIHAIENQPPVVTLKRPARDLKATLLQEIPVEARVTDDFGLSKVELVLRVNSRPERTLAMQANAATGRSSEALELDAKDFRGLIYLEDLEVEPGDFLTYYVKARDAALQAEAVSEMYYIEIRNFEEIYTLATSQQAAASGQGSNLSALQKDIITATTNLIRDRNVYDSVAYKDKVGKLFEAQQNVREGIERTYQAIRMRMNMLRGKTKEMGKELELAIAAMLQAEPLIAADSLRAALTPEREAYHHLLKVDAMNRKRQVSMGNSAASSFQADQDELTRLFHDELDKLKNKYETLQQGDRQQSEQAVNEALRQIQELARRQQSLNEQSRQLAQNQLTPEEKKRQIKKLQRQQEQLNRDMRKMAQQMTRNQKLSNSQTMRDLQQAGKAMNEASRQLRKQEPMSAAASGQQAVNRMQNLEQQLRKAKENALRQEIQDLNKQFQDMAQEQKALAEKNRQLQGKLALARAGELDEQQKQALIDAIRRQIQEQAQLRSSLDAARDQMQQLAHGSPTKPELQKDLRNIAKDLQRQGISERMRQSEEAMRVGSLRQAVNLQKKAERALTAAADKLARSLPKMQDSPEEKLELALQQTQGLRENLERQLSQQPAQPESQTGTPRQQGRQMQPQDDQPGNPATTGQELTEAQMRKWRELLWQTKENLEQIREQFKVDASGVGPGESLDQAIQGVVQTFRGGNPARLQQIESQILDPLRRFESELATALQVYRSKETLRTVFEDDTSPEYRQLVEEYYRLLGEKE